VSRASGDWLRRTAALVAAVGPVWFVVLTVVLGLLWPGYDPIRDTTSELGAVNAPHSVLMNVAGFMGLGVSILAFAVAYGLSFRAGWPIALVMALLAVAGFGMVTVGFFPCDAGCVDVTATGQLHSVFSAPGAIGVPTAAMLSSWVFHRDGRLGRSWQSGSLTVGVLTLASGPVVAAGFLHGSEGLAQRAGMFPAVLWMAVVAAWTLRFPTRDQGSAAWTGQPAHLDRR
jgi:hypothetical membrane protein